MKRFDSQEYGNLAYSLNGTLLKNSGILHSKNDNNIQ